VIRREGDKVYKEFDETYPKANVFNEALNQVRVEETTLNIPHILDVMQNDGRWTIVMEYIEGETLAQRMEKHPEKMEEYIDQLVALQVDMQKREAPPLLNRLRDKMRRKLASPELDINPSIRYELQTRLDSMPKHRKLCHGDFEPRNIIFGKDGKTYIIDWAHAAQGNTGSDAAKTYLVLVLKYGKEVGDMYLKKFSLAANMPIQYIQQWMPIMAASHLLRTNERHKDFLMGWLDVFDYE
jgi:tRNA A-37 threonylcarbamoyl transferase component Bud32